MEDEDAKYERTEVSNEETCWRAAEASEEILDGCCNSIVKSGALSAPSSRYRYRAGYRFSGRGGVRCFCKAGGWFSD